MRVRTEARREAILETAARVFMEFGYERASMAHIAEHTPCSKPTLYGYFPSKADLFMDVVLRQLGCQGEPVFQQLSSLAAEDPATVLVQAGERFIGLISSLEAYAMRRLIVATMTSRADAEHFWELGSKKALLAVESYLAAATRAGRLKVEAPWAAAQQLLALYEAEVHWGGPLGFAPKLSEAMIHDASRRAVSVFLAAYGVAGTA